MNTSEQIKTNGDQKPQLTGEQEDMYTPEKIAERLAAFERLQNLLSQGNSTSGRNGRPWREWINDHEE